MYERHMAVKDAAAEKEREELQAVVADRNEGGFARERALESLMDRDWEGRDAWFLGLFADKSMMECEERGSYVTIYRPLAMIVGRAPDTWVPRVTKLVGNTERMVHDNAVECLIQFQLENAREDALKPLIPWLSDPNWSSASDRLRLIQSMDRVNLPESVPGLLWVLEHDREGFARAGAAEGLAHLRPREAGPELRKAFAKEYERIHEKPLVEALIACEALSAKEMVDAIEAFARREPPEEGDGMMQWAATDARSKQVTLGGWLTQMAGGQASVGDLAVARLRELQKTEPAIAQRMAWWIRKWPTTSLDGYLAETLAREADEYTVVETVERRASMRKEAKQELRARLADGKAAAGVAAVILEDGDAQRAILQGQDTAAKEMLLACARLGQAKLPLGDVSKLLESKEGMVAQAAEAYLMTDGSATALRALAARHPGEVLVIGTRMGQDPGHTTYDFFDQREADLAAEFKKAGGPDEVYALLAGGYSGGPGQCIIRMKGDQATIRLEPNAEKHRERALMAAERDGLVKWLREQRVDDLPELDIPVSDGVQYEYVHLTKDGGRRVFMNNPGVGESAGTVYAALRRTFEHLAEAGDFTSHFAIADWVPGTEVLYEGKERLMGVWGKGADVRVGVEEKMISLEVWERNWHAIKGGKMGTARVEEPEEWQAVGARTDVPTKDCLIYWHLNQPRWKVQAGEWVIRTLDDRTSQGKGFGLYRCADGKAPECICTGEYAHPVLSADGKWAVTTRSDEGWAHPYSLVRVKLETGEVVPLEVARGEGEVITRVGDRVLVEWNETFQLVDAVTGKMEEVKGEFRPLLRQTRPLQPTGKEGEVWAAIEPEEMPDGKAEKVTSLGKYDMNSFRFVPVGEFPGLSFSSDKMWVDGDKVYVLVESDVLRMPVKGTK